MRWQDVGGRFVFACQRRPSARCLTDGHNGRHVVVPSRWWSRQCRAASVAWIRQGCSNRLSVWATLCPFVCGVRAVRWRSLRVGIACGARFALPTPPRIHGRRIEELWQGSVASAAVRSRRCVRHVFANRLFLCWRRVAPATRPIMDTSEHGHAPAYSPAYSADGHLLARRKQQQQQQ